MKSTFGDRLKQIRENKGMTQEEIADILGTSKQVISRYENNQRTPKLTVAVEYAEKLGVPTTYLLDDSAEPHAPLPPNLMPMPKFNKRIPILGTIACGEPILATQEATEYLDIDDLIDADFALYCKGDSMIEARIYDGDIVCIREQSRVEEGEIAAVIIEEHCEYAEATLKKVYVKEDRIILRPCNLIYNDIVIPRKEAEKVRIIGKATHFISRVR